MSEEITQLRMQLMSEERNRDSSKKQKSEKWILAKKKKATDGTGRGSFSSNNDRIS